MLGEFLSDQAQPSALSFHPSPAESASGTVVRSGTTSMNQAMTFPAACHCYVHACVKDPFALRRPTVLSASWSGARSFKTTVDCTSGLFPPSVDSDALLCFGRRSDCQGACGTQAPVASPTPVPTDPTMAFPACASDVFSRNQNHTQ